MRLSKHGISLALLFLLYNQYVNASINAAILSNHGTTIYKTAQTGVVSSFLPSSSAGITNSRLLSPRLLRASGALAYAANKTILSVRGGGTHSPSSTDPTRTLWSSSSSMQQPTSSTGGIPFSYSQSPRSPQSPSYRTRNQQQGGITVTDVTQDVKDRERERTKDAINSFLTRESRNSFIIKVYTILTGQLVLVALSALLFGRYPALGRWMMTSSTGRFVPWASVLISTLTVLIMTVSERARQVAPLKWQLLGLFSISEAIVVGLISSFYKSKTVMSAALSTAVATMSVTMYTFFNKDAKRDLSQWGAGLSSMGMIFVFYGMVHLLSMSGILPPEFLPYNETLYCFLGTSLFSLYLAYHTRLVVSGKHSKYQLNEKDYVFGAVLLYNDIINMFLYMLRLLADDGTTTREQ